MEGYIKFFATLLLLILGSKILAQNKIQSFPDSIWSWHDPVELVGYDSKKLDEVRNYVIDSMNTTGLVVLLDGKILFDHGNIEELSYLASCRKSILSMMFGKYVDNGTIDLDMTLDKLNFNDINGLLPIERKATIRNLITARSGVFHPASNGSYELKFAPTRGSVEAGSYHIYNNWDFNAAGAIFEMLTMRNIYETFEQDIAIPIHMQDFKLVEQKKVGDTTQSNYLAYHFVLSTRDMAKLGLLMLNNGNWNGKQLIPASWVKLSTSPVTPPDQINTIDLRDGDFGYGYMWWIWCSDNELLKESFWARGAMGQYIVIIPKLNMVISHKTKPDYGRDTNILKFKKLVNLIIDSRLN